MVELNITGMVDRLAEGELEPTEQKILAIIVKALIRKGAEVDGE